MKFVSFSMIAWMTISFTSVALAQLDSSYELLLGVSVPNEAPKAKSRKAQIQEKRKIASDAEEKAKAEPKLTSTSTPNVQSGPSEKVSAQSMEPGRPLPIKLQPANGESYPQPEEPSFSDQAQSLFAAEPEKVLNYYSAQFAEEDPRRNKVEILFAPTFVTNESSSNYSFRDYRSVFSALNVGANVWLTPALGIGGNFLFSMGADTSGGVTTGTRSPARHELFDVALKFRQFYGFSSQSKSVSFDILYSDYKFNVPSDDLHRVRIKSSGVGIKSTLRVPTSPDFAWLFGGSFFPRLQHAETANSQNVSSGESSENVRIGIHAGADVKLSKESQVFFEASASSEKNLFGGSASVVDPATGAAPKNASVTNTMYLMSLGYRWGN